jgi:putative nucleotidyltransferase with HDIG domain
MAFDPNLEEQDLLADTLAQQRSTMSARETLATALLGVALLGAVAGLWAARPPGTVALAPAVLAVLVLALAARVSFDTPFGFTGLTQLAFVPLLFAMPLALVPPAVAAGLALGLLPEVVRGRRPAVRLLSCPANAWFAVGPAAVLIAAGSTPARAGAWLLLAALGAQFLADFVASSIRFRLSRKATLSAQLRDTWVYAIDAALSGVALVLARQIRSEPAVVLAMVPLLGLFAVLSRERRERLQSLIELGNAYRGTALVLGDVVEADDGYTGTHCRSVLALALEVADRLDLDAVRRRNLEFAALLHDVGKIAVPKEIIRKPGPLDAAEWAVMQRHTIEGQRMLEQVGGFMKDVGAVVRSHHERWDGSGYPDGLVGPQISLEARIVSCCDMWNAMRTDRPYRPALSHDAAMAELRACSGSQLDPEIVTALVEVVAGDRLQALPTATRVEPRSSLLAASGRASVA